MNRKKILRVKKRFDLLGKQLEMILAKMNKQREIGQISFRENIALHKVHKERIEIMAGVFAEVVAEALKDRPRRRKK